MSGEEIRYVARAIAARFLCNLVGCRETDAPCCARCGVDFYDDVAPFINRVDSVLGPLFLLWWWLRSCRLPRCRHCGRVLWPWRSRGGSVLQDPAFCSKACEDAWLPF